MEIVIDASCFTAMLLNEEVPEAVGDLLARIPMIAIVVPALWYWEVGNAALTATRRHRIAPNEVREQPADFRSLNIEIDTDSMSGAWSATHERAVQHHLTSYDAAYLERARRRHLTLATLDGPLAKAARAEGVEVIGG